MTNQMVLDYFSTLSFCKKIGLSHSIRMVFIKQHWLFCSIIVLFCLLVAYISVELKEGKYDRFIKKSR